MPRNIPVSNGNLLVAFDHNYVLREFYYPYAGQENHAGGELFRIGVWVDGKFSWFSPEWNIAMDYAEDSMITQVTLVNNNLNIRITTNDCVDFFENAYIKKLTVENLSADTKDVRIFFCQNFNIYGTDIGDTAAYKPDVNALLHYKGERYFLINCYAENKYGIDQYATGKKEQPGFEGTWRDAEDGILSGNPIAQGSVDSVIGINLTVKGNDKNCFYYWISAGRDWNEVNIRNSVIMEKHPESLIKRTHDYWKLWVNKENLNYDLIPEKVAWLYKRSLLILRTNINNCGSIIAANDSDSINFNRDTYSYMWPRDGALTAYALDQAAYETLTESFFLFCAKIIEKEGYFLHKYNPSGSLASSWHPWIHNNKPHLPIQEDETALVVWALWYHFLIHKDVEFIKPLYKSLIKNSADFMLSYRNAKTGLPRPSYDLWEEREGILTFTTAAVYGGLIAAANFTEAFGELEVAQQYRQGAQEIRAGMDQHLFLEKENRFARMINFNDDGSKVIDATIDASLFGIFAFGAYDPQDPKVQSTMNQVFDTLWCKNSVGGLSRYENDGYYRVSMDVQGNPWFVTTLWLAQYYIAIAETKEDLNKGLDLLQWVADRALPSGVLAEQVNPNTDEPLSVSPLTWSHATYISVFHNYLDKLCDIEKCHICSYSKYIKKT